VNPTTVTIQAPSTVLKDLRAEDYPQGVMVTFQRPGHGGPESMYTLAPGTMVLLVAAESAVGFREQLRQADEARAQRQRAALQRSGRARKRR